MRLFGELTAEQRAIFASIPRIYDDPGEELDRLAKELQDGNSKLPYSVALERAMTTRPDLGHEHIFGDE